MTTPEPGPGSQLRSTTGRGVNTAGGREGWPVGGGARGERVSGAGAHNTTAGVVDDQRGDPRTRCRGVAASGQQADGGKALGGRETLCVCCAPPAVRGHLPPRWCMLPVCARATHLAWRASLCATGRAAGAWPEPRRQQWRSRAHTPTRVQAHQGRRPQPAWLRPLREDSPRGDASGERANSESVVLFLRRTRQAPRERVD